MDSPIVKIDDKHVPLFRIVWISDVPHFCGEDDCMHEGDYEVRLDVDDSIWTSAADRDKAIDAIKKWCSDPTDQDSGDWE